MLSRDARSRVSLATRLKRQLRSLQREKNQYYNEAAHQGVLLAKWAGITIKGPPKDKEQVASLREETMLTLKLDPDVTGPW